MGKPALLEEPKEKITVVLLERHVDVLDRLREGIRAKYGRAIARSEVIRAIVDVAATRYPVSEEDGSVDDALTEPLANGIGTNLRRRRR
jgi:hypothetical protein